MEAGTWPEVGYCGGVPTVDRFLTPSAGTGVTQAASANASVCVATGLGWPIVASRRGRELFVELWSGGKCLVDLGLPGFRSSVIRERYDTSGNDFVRARWGAK